MVGFTPSNRDVAAVHLAKNFLVESIRGKVPLILGVWGAKGCGKSFNVELCCKRMGLTPIIISAGELEDEWAGEPGKVRATPTATRRRSLEMRVQGLGFRV